MKKIVCFYWQGDRWQETTSQTQDTSFDRHVKRVGLVSKELAARYVNNLYNGVRRWTKEPFDFICFTNEDLVLNKEIEIRPFPLITTKGVLPRMYMFSEAAGLFGHQVLSLDIDLIITGSLDDLLKYEGVFCTRMSWTRGEQHLIDGDIMSFKAGKETEAMFWTPLVKDIKAVEKISGGGRERMWMRYIIGNKADTWQQLIPGQVCSYKHHFVPTGKIPYGARIISCHGFPRPHQIMDKWRTEFWK